MNECCLWWALCVTVRYLSEPVCACAGRARSSSPSSPCPTLPLPLPLPKLNPPMPSSRSPCYPAVFSTPHATTDASICEGGAAPAGRMVQMLHSSTKHRLLVWQHQHQPPPATVTLIHSTRHLATPSRNDGQGRGGARPSHGAYRHLVRRLQAPPPLHFPHRDHFPPRLEPPPPPPPVRLPPRLPEDVPAARPDRPCGGAGVRQEPRGGLQKGRGGSATWYGPRDPGPLTAVTENGLLLSTK